MLRVRFFLESSCDRRSLEKNVSIAIFFLESESMLLWRYHLRGETDRPGGGTVSWSAALAAASCATEGRPSSPAARSFRDRLESPIFQSSSLQCAPRWHSRRGEEAAWPPWPDPTGGGGGVWVIMMSLHLPLSLLRAVKAHWGNRRVSFPQESLLLLLLAVL